MSITLEQTARNLQFVFSSKNNEQKIVQVNTLHILGHDQPYCRRVVDSKPESQERANYKSIDQIIRIAASAIMPIDETEKMSWREIGRRFAAASEEEQYQVNEKIWKALMPNYGYDPENHSDLEDFAKAFSKACEAHVEYRTSQRGIFRPALNDKERRILELQAGIDAAREPIKVLRYICHPDAKTRYEATELAVSVLQTIDTIKKSEEINGDDADFITILEEEVFIPETALEEEGDREIISYHDEETGDCLEWYDYDPEYKTELKVIEKDGTITHRERYHSLPSRITKRGKIKVHYEQNTKKNGSKSGKTRRKLEVPDDMYRIRMGFDEHREDLSFKDQVNVVLDSIKLGCETRNFTFRVNTDPTSITNTTGEVFEVAGFTVVPKENKHNPGSSHIREILQLELEAVHNDTGRVIRAEVQIERTIGRLKRIFHKEVFDEGYKVVQQFLPLNHGRQTTMAQDAFPMYIYGVNLQAYQESLINLAHRRVMNDSGHLSLPNENIEIPDTGFEELQAQILKM